MHDLGTHNLNVIALPRECNDGRAASLCTAHQLSSGSSTTPGSFGSIGYFLIISEIFLVGYVDFVFS